MSTSRLVPLVALGALLLPACPSGPLRGGGSLEGAIEPGGAGAGSLTVDNPTGDTWDLVVDGVPKGSVGPRSQARIPVIAAGAHTVVASSAGLGLTQDANVVVRAGEVATSTLRALVARLEVSNPHDVAVDIAVDGVVIGRAPPHADTVFDAVPAGRRLLMARAPTGPGSARLEQRLAPGGKTTWTLPALADGAAAGPTLPTPPLGMGLVRMRNASRLPVFVYADGVDKGLVAPGATVDFVLAPGTHALEVRMEGLEARTEHTVSLLPNQAAEWVWGDDGGL